MAEIYARNVASASKHQRPVDWVLSDRVTQYELRELALDPVWAPFIKKGQQAAKEIETARFEGGFTKSLSQLLLEWEEKHKMSGGEEKKLDADVLELDGRCWTLGRLIESIQSVAVDGPQSQHSWLVWAADGRPRYEVVAFLERIVSKGTAQSSFAREGVDAYELARRKFGEQHAAIRLEMARRRDA